jgi:hypothetical protein
MVAVVACSRLSPLHTMLYAWPWTPHGKSIWCQARPFFCLSSKLSRLNLWAPQALLVSCIRTRQVILYLLIVHQKRPRAPHNIASCCEVYMEVTKSKHTCFLTRLTVFLLLNRKMSLPQWLIFCYPHAKMDDAFTLNLCYGDNVWRRESWEWDWIVVLGLHVKTHLCTNLAEKGCMHEFYSQPCCCLEC